MEQTDRPAEHDPQSGMSSPDRSTLFWMLGALVFYGALRLIAWANTTLFADVDSLVYLAGIDTYATWSWREIDTLSPDLTPLYLVLSALARWITGDTVSGATLVSLLSAFLLAVVVGLIARAWSGTAAGVIAIVLLAVNAMMIDLSVAVLTESTYIATVYLGAYLLWRRIDKADFGVKSALILGVVFALAFLNRVEGILFLVAVPAIVAGIQLVSRRARSPVFTDLRVPGWHAGRWIILYVVAFLVLALPQVTHVSEKMGEPALNGRVAWLTLWNSMPDRSSDEILFGLDFAPGDVNIRYFLENYQEAKERVGSNNRDGSRLVTLADNALRNIDRIHRSLLPDTMTPLGLSLALLGALALFLRNALTAVFALLVGAVLIAAPLTHPIMYSRHVSILVPLFVVIQAVGIVYTARLLSNPANSVSLRPEYVMAALVGLSIAVHFFPTKNSLRPPGANKDYDPSFLADPADYIRKSGAERLATRRKYLSYFSGTHFVLAPFSDYPNLVCYLSLNEVDLLYVDFERMRDYPYVQRFINSEYTADFSRVWLDSHSSEPRAAIFELRESASCDESVETKPRDTVLQQTSLRLRSG